MKKVPIFAGIGLATVAVVVGLSWGARLPINPTDAVPVFATVSVRPETIQLFSAFGGHSEKQEFPQPSQPTTRTPEIKADPKKLRQVQSTKDFKPATKSNQKRPPAVPNSGHIL
jgi:hypothetical protein